MPSPVIDAQPAAARLRGNDAPIEKCIFLLGAAVLLAGAVAWTARSPLAERTDFSLTYLGARMVHEDHGEKLYDLSEQEKLRKSLFKNPNPTVFEHPPFEALVLAPLSRLSYRTAYLVSGLVNTWIWLLVAYIFRPYAPVPRSDLGYFALWLWFAPLGIALYQGQSSLLIMLFYCLTFVSLKQGREFRAGLWQGLALLKFQFAIPFALIFFFRRKWRFIAGFVTTAAAVGVLSLVAVGFEGVWSYFRLLLTAAGSPNQTLLGSAVEMATLQGFVHALLGKEFTAGTISLIVGCSSGFLILSTAWVWKRQEQSGPAHRFDLMFAAAIVVSLVTGAHMFTHDLSPLMLSTLLVVAHFPPRNKPQLRALLGATLAIFWILPLYFALIAWHCMYLFFPILMVFAVATMILARGSLGSSIPVEEAAAG
jgi:hypothetical protein